MFCVSFEIDDLGGRQGDTAQARALVQWQHPVASSLALDVPHRVTLILLSPTTIGKDNVMVFYIRPSYITIIYQYLISLFKVFGHPPTMMDAVLATIVDG